MTHADLDTAGGMVAAVFLVVAAGIGVALIVGFILICGGK